jgi:hypothetical protein
MLASTEMILWAPDKASHLLLICYVNFHAAIEKKN